jgi:hypothetical protein
MKTKRAKRNQKVSWWDRLSPIQKLLGSVVTAVVTLVGLGSGILSILPSVSATLSDAHDPRDPFTSSITVQNTGLVPIRDVQLNVAIADINMKPNRKTIGLSGGKNYSTELHLESWIPRDMGRDERYSVPFSGMFTHPKGETSVEQADIALVVHYKTPWIAWSRKKVFPYKRVVTTMETSSGMRTLLEIELCRCRFVAAGC